MALPSDVLRTHVLPFLDYATRLDANSVLDRDSRLVMKLKKEDVLQKDAVTYVRRLIDDGHIARDQLLRVKRVIRLCRYIQTPFGRLMLKHKRFAEVLLLKTCAFGKERPSSWWNRSPYRKQLKTELERVRDMIIVA